MGYYDQEDLIELFDSWEEDRHYQPVSSRKPAPSVKKVAKVKKVVTENSDVRGTIDLNDVNFTFDDDDFE